MTCEDCSAAQSAFVEGTGGSYPIRIGRANVLIVGCLVHAGEAIRRINPEDA